MSLPNHLTPHQLTDFAGKSYSQSGMNYFDLVKASGLTTQTEIVLDEDRLARLQAATLRIARDVRDYCARNDIDIVLAAGSVLGAVRHAGFIPWDDDIDFLMTRQGWRRFLPGFAAEYRGIYEVIAPETSDGHWPTLQIKIARQGTRVREALTPPEGATGVAVDVFLVESVPRLRIVRLAHGLGSQGLRLIASSVRLWRNRRYFASVVPPDTPAARWLRRRSRLGSLFSFFSPLRWVRVADTWHRAVRTPRSRYVTSPSNVGHYFGELVRRDVLFPARPVEFEGEQWPGPAEPEAYLSQRYGSDWHIEPPEGERPQHVFVEFELGGTAPRPVRRSGGSAA